MCRFCLFLILKALTSAITVQFLANIIIIVLFITAGRLVYTFTGVLRVRLGLMIDVQGQLVGLRALILRFFRLVFQYRDLFIRRFKACNCHFDRGMMMFLINKVDLLILRGFIQ